MIDKKLRKALLAVQKPGRYTGGELGSVYKDPEKMECRFAFCFPDTYEVGMSFLGMKVLYEILNARENIWCERAFMPWVDMLEQMRNLKIPLFSIESKTPLSKFDIVGFTLQYELSYSNILAMLDLAEIPFYARKRGPEYPLIVAGGPCTCNAEPVADFFDAIMLGEGEQQLPDLCDAVIDAKRRGLSKEELLLNLSKIKGVYVPSLYSVSYNKDGTVKHVTAHKGAPRVIEKAILPNFRHQPLPTHFTVPMVGAVHDRAMIEVLRGCVRGCRFCQAGFIYRPMRERDADMLNGAAQDLCRNTGYDEISLTSLSTSDHSQLEPLLDKLLAWTPDEHINLALPSLRIDNFSESLVEKTTRVRKSGLTFAPEAGTQRLRDVINKNVTMGGGAAQLHPRLRERLHRGQAVFHDGSAHRDDGGHQGNRRHPRRRWSISSTACPPSRRGRGSPSRSAWPALCRNPLPRSSLPRRTRWSSCTKNSSTCSAVCAARRSRSATTTRGSAFLRRFLPRATANCPRYWSRPISAAVVLTAGATCSSSTPGSSVLKSAGSIWRFSPTGRSPLTRSPRGSISAMGVDKSFLIEEFNRAQKAQTTMPCNRRCSGCGANKLMGGGRCIANDQSVVR